MAVSRAYSGMDLRGCRLTGVGEPVAAGDAVSLGFLQAALTEQAATIAALEARLAAVEGRDQLVMGPELEARLAAVEGRDQLVVGPDQPAIPEGLWVQTSASGTTFWVITPDGTHGTT